VRIPALDQFVSEHGKKRPEIKIGLDRLIERERANRDSLYRAFVSYWKKLQKNGFRRRLECAIMRLAEPVADETQAETASDTNDGS
jgi:hypothetical protein